MTEPFRGRFEIKVDPKYRMTLPASFRDSLGARKNQRLVITNGLYQGHNCLDAYSFTQWTQLEKKIAKLPQLKIEVQNFQRFYLSGGQVVEVDGHGRILIPPTLRQYGDIGNEVVVVGFAHKFEIWAKSKWNKLFKNMSGDFTSTLEALSLLEDSKNG